MAHPRTEQAGGVDRRHREVVQRRGEGALDSEGRPEERDVVQNIYIRRCEMKDGKLWNIEFDKVENVKDPG